MKKTLSTTRIRLGALILGVLLWFFVKMGEEYSTVITMPLETINIHPDRVMSEPLPESAEVKISGTGKDLLLETLQFKWIDNNSRKLILDLDQIKQNYKFPLTEYYKSEIRQFVISRSEKIQLLEILTPDTVFVRLSIRSEKYIPIIPKVEINLSAGYILVGSPKIEPEFILISGPSDIVQSVSAVNSEIVSLEKIQTDIYLNLKAELFHDLIQLDPEKFQYSATVQKIGEREILDIPVQIENLDTLFAYSLRPSMISAVIEGGIDAIRNLTGQDFYAFVELPQHIVEGTLRLAISLDTLDVVNRISSISVEFAEVEIH